MLLFGFVRLSLFKLLFFAYTQFSLQLNQTQDYLYLIYVKLNQITVSQSYTQFSLQLNQTPDYVYLIYVKLNQIIISRLLLISIEMTIEHEVLRRQAFFFSWILGHLVGKKWENLWLCFQPPQTVSERMIFFASLWTKACRFFKGMPLLDLYLVLRLSIFFSWALSFHS